MGGGLGQGRPDIREEDGGGLQSAVGKVATRGGKTGSRNRGTQKKRGPGHTFQKPDSPNENSQKKTGKSRDIKGEGGCAARNLRRSSGGRFQNREISHIGGRGDDERSISQKTIDTRIPFSWVSDVRKRRKPPRALPQFWCRWTKGMGRKPSLCSAEGSLQLSGSVSRGTLCSSGGSRGRFV